MQMLETIDPQILGRHHTLEEYLALPEGPPYYELEDGVLVPVSSANYNHGEWMGDLYGAIKAWRATQGGYVTLRAGVLPGGNYVFIPDIAFLFQQHLDRLQFGRVQGVPNLVVEVFDHEGARRDRVQKFNLYGDIGIEWYWLVHYEDRVIEEYHLVSGAYLRTAAAGPGDEFRSCALEGLVIAVDKLGSQLG